MVSIQNWTLLENRRGKFHILAVGVLLSSVTEQWWTCWMWSAYTSRNRNTVRCTHRMVTWWCYWGDLKLQLLGVVSFKMLHLKSLSAAMVTHYRRSRHESDDSWRETSDAEDVTDDTVQLKLYSPRKHLKNSALLSVCVCHVTGIYSSCLFPCVHFMSIKRSGSLKHSSNTQQTDIMQVCVCFCCCCF